VKSEIRGRMKGTTKIEDLKDCDVIVEAIIEQLPAKRELFSALDAICPATTIFASNTSSLTITEIATATKRPQRFVGCIFSIGAGDEARGSGADDCDGTCDL